MGNNHFESCVFNAVFSEDALEGWYFYTSVEKGPIHVWCGRYLVEKRETIKIIVCLLVTYNQI